MLNDVFDEFVSWLAVFDVWQYIFSAYSPFTDNPDLKNEITIAERDFNGHDYTSWVYDLFHPNEPYNMRGTHSSGVGIDRYIKSTDLTEEDLFYFTPRISIGIRPKDQGFFTSEMEFFGLMGGRFDFQITKNWLPYFEIVAKTDGWVAGNEFLNNNISCKLGISARF